MRRRAGLPTRVYGFAVLMVVVLVLLVRGYHWYSERPRVLEQQGRVCSGTDIVGTDWILRLCSNVDAIVAIDLRDRVVTATPFPRTVVAVASNPRDEVALAIDNGSVIVVDRALREVGRFATAPGGVAQGLAWRNERWEAVDLSGVYGFNGETREHTPFPSPASQWYQYLGIELVRGRWAQIWWTHEGIASLTSEGTELLCAKPERDPQFAISMRAPMRGRGLLQRKRLYIELGESSFKPSRRFEAASFSIDGRPSSGSDGDQTSCLRPRSQRLGWRCEHIFLLGPTGLDFVDRCINFDWIWIGDQDLLAIKANRLVLGSVSRDLPTAFHSPDPARPPPISQLLVDPLGRPVLLGESLRRAVVYDADLNVVLDLWLEHQVSVKVVAELSRPPPYTKPVSRLWND